MKQIALYLVIIALLTGCATVPAPKMAVGIPFGEDSVKWTTQNFNADPNGFLMEFTPEEQQLKDWREMVAQQILFTSQSLPLHLDEWLNLMTSADSSIDIQLISEEDSSSTWYYRSNAFNEVTLRRFWQGPDGIYSLAYHARTNETDEERFDLWKKIIDKSTLVRNPASR